MAIRKADPTGSQSRKVSYPRTSKMRKYNVFFDSEDGQNKLGFYKRIADRIKVEENGQVSNDVTIYTVEAGTAYRTDLISVKFYGTSKYDWVIEDVNNIRDPIKDVTPGTKLVIPNKAKIYSAT